MTRALTHNCNKGHIVVTTVTEDNYTRVRRTNFRTSNGIFYTANTVTKPYSPAHMLPAP